MILSESVVVRGKLVSVSELKRSSSVKVAVQCPKCMRIRQIHYRSVVKAGHFVCQKCMMVERSVRLAAGSKYGKLTVIEDGRPGYSVCVCDCGMIKQISNYALRTGQVSCGCIRKLNFNNVQRPSGENHGMWKGGVAKEREAAMQTKKYKEWRQLVFERDNFTCQKCLKIGQKLNAHHVFDYASFPDQRYEVGNGITFCLKCHLMFHSLYGRKNNRAHIESFLKEQ